MEQNLFMRFTAASALALIIGMPHSAFAEPEEDGNNDNEEEPSETVVVHQSGKKWNFLHGGGISTSVSLGTLSQDANHVDIVPNDDETLTPEQKRQLADCKEYLEQMRDGIVAVHVMKWLLSFYDNEHDNDALNAKGRREAFIKYGNPSADNFKHRTKSSRAEFSESDCAGLLSNSAIDVIADQSLEDILK